jgi:hypothetical protein
MVTHQSSLQREERLVAELAQLGVAYLSRQTEDLVSLRMPQIVLAELVRQPTSRVRFALISLLLAKPEYAAYIPIALKRLTPKEAQTLKILYTAALCLQQQNADLLKGFQKQSWVELPDLFSVELGVVGASPQERLRVLAGLQAQWTGIYLNWVGSFENAASHLIRHWQLEQIWKQ